MRVQTLKRCQINILFNDFPERGPKPSVRVQTFKRCRINILLKVSQKGGPKPSVRVQTLKRCRRRFRQENVDGYIYIYTRQTERSIERIHILVYVHMRRALERICFHYMLQHNIRTQVSGSIIPYASRAGRAGGGSNQWFLFVVPYPEPGGGSSRNIAYIYIYICL